VNLCIC